MCAPRLACLASDRAFGWRWELAQLELGARAAWPRPGSRIWAARAAWLGAQLRAEHGPIVLAFDGYSLVGAVWPRVDHPVLPRGPLVMPQFRGGALERRLLAAWLRSCERVPGVVVPPPAVLEAAG